MKKSYESAPAGTGSKGLDGAKGASSISSDAPTYGASRKQALGLPYDSTSAGPTYGGGLASRTGKLSKSYELIPGKEVASRGLGKGEAPVIAGGTPVYGASNTKALGVPYTTKGATSTYEGGTPPRVGKQPKSYELIPGAGSATKGAGKGCAGCGCGGKCGEKKGYEVFYPVAKKSGGCGPGKASGCGCGGKCGGSGGGILLPSSTAIALSPSVGVLLAPLQFPLSDRPLRGSQQALMGVLSPGRLSDPTTDIRFPLEPPLPPLRPAPGPTSSCEELRRDIDHLLAKIRFLQTSPTPGTCLDCPEGTPPEACRYNCDGLPEAMRHECACIRYYLGLPMPEGHTWLCLERRTSYSSETAADIEELCKPGEAVSRMTDKLKELLEKLKRQRCEGPPPPPPPLDPDWCRHFPDVCERLRRANCILNLRQCLDLPTPPRRIPVPDPPPDPAGCSGMREGLDRLRQIYHDIMAIHDRLVELTRFLREPPPLTGSSGFYACRSAPSCPQLLALKSSLDREFVSSPAPSDGSLFRPRLAIQSVFYQLRVRLALCDSGVILCSDLTVASSWASIRESMNSLIGDILDMAREAGRAADDVLDYVADDLFARGCRIPDRLLPRR